MRFNVVLFLRRTGSSLGGDIQSDLGQALTKMTDGRFERVNATSRLATLLPEIGWGLAPQWAPRRGSYVSSPSVPRAATSGV